MTMGNHVIISLMVLKWFELTFTTDARQGEVTLLVLCHETSADKLLEQVKGSLAFTFVVFHHLHLGLKNVVLLELGLRLLLLSLLRCLIIGNLLLGPLSLA